MSKCYITVKDEVWVFITGLHGSHNEFLYNKFGIYKDGYFFAPTYKMGRWDGKIRFFEKTGKTYSRLLDKIIPIVDGWGYEIELKDERKYVGAPSVPGQITKVDAAGLALEATGTDIFDNKEILARPYQLQCIKAAVEAGSGFIIAGTGAGKTLITAGLSQIYSSKGFKTITIVPSGDLVDQTAKWYTNVGLDVGIYSGTEKDVDHANVVATWQSLQYNPSIIQDFDVFIWDEAHGVGAEVARKLINDHGKNIAFRFGVTGTFPKGEVDQYNLFSSIGPILIEVPAHWLIEHGYLAKLVIEPVEIKEVNVEENFVDYSAEKAFLSKSLPRMELIADLIISKCIQHGNTLVLVNSISFGKKLSALIKDSVFLYGESSSELRKEHYEMFETRNDVIVIASSGIASTGISIDRIFCQMLIDPGKSFVKAIQSVGRGLRKGGDKHEVFVVDVYSDLKWAKKHHKERLKYYNEAKYPIAEKQKIKVKS